MKKLVQVFLTLSMIMFLSVTPTTTRADDPQGGGDTGSGDCHPPKVCKPVSRVNNTFTSTTNNYRSTYDLFFDMLLLYVKFGLRV
jgi:hypothetical protein